MGNYDRGSAIEYARMCWITVCTDGFIAGPAGAVPVNRATHFVHDVSSNGRHSEHAVQPTGQQIGWNQLDDCTHFISCCVGQPPLLPAGGIPLPFPTSDYPGQQVYGFGNVGKLKNHLVAQGIATVVGEKTKDRQLIMQMRSGDLIVYHRGFQSNGDHFAMLLEDGDGTDSGFNPKIVCHTYCRSDDPACTWDNKWNLGEDDPNWFWTFLKMND